ncbi:hypothetical protein TPA0908_02330 [Micromonospora sp. AKA38]|nr:hypothetical protein TPA0908_02330 [Micromonospora sp. AKA38]
MAGLRPLDQHELIAFVPQDRPNRPTHDFTHVDPYQYLLKGAGDLKLHRDIAHAQNAQMAYLSVAWSRQWRGRAPDSGENKQFMRRPELQMAVIRTDGLT